MALRTPTATWSALSQCSLTAVIYKAARRRDTSLLARLSAAAA